MILQEKTTLQRECPNTALAFKEGVFYKVYNEGAWLLRHLNYKMQQKGKGEIRSVYIGFPESVLQTMALDDKIAYKSDFVEIHTGLVFDKSTYTSWKVNTFNEIERYANTSQGNTSHNNDKTSQQVLNEIAAYPLANKTPIEVFIWVSSIQSLIRES